MPSIDTKQHHMMDCGLVMIVVDGNDGDWDDDECGAECGGFGGK